MLPVNWDYSPEEWLKFRRWEARYKRGLWGSLVFYFKNLSSKSSARVRIGTNEVWINNSPKTFQNNQCRLMDVSLREERALNVLNIRYEMSNRLYDIVVPVPKGRLREAIEVEEYLRLSNTSV